MYIPGPFTVTADHVRDLLREITVGQLVTATERGPMATLLPWIVDVENNVLVAHMARPNAQWQTPWHGQALVIAEGPNGYVSPSWYATKAENGRVVPTWDYLVLQVYGDLVVHDDHAWVDAAVRRLTDRHEQQRVEPWRVDDAPADYIDGQLRGIVGVEVRIDRIEVSVKMSQNKSDADASGVLAGFIADGNGAIAEWVERVNL
jgi:transcriptional regulator